MFARISVKRISVKLGLSLNINDNSDSIKGKDPGLRQNSVKLLFL